MKTILAAAGLACSMVVFVACGDDEEATTDGGVAMEPCVPRPAAEASPPRCSADASDTSLPACEQWTKVEPAGAECSDGSQYKFFVNYAAGSDNLVIMFEPGGACWDFASCTGSARGAANPNGISDEHMAQYQYLNLIRRTEDNPLHDWNFVFVPYCTGDIHAGDKIATYEDPAGGPALTFRHVGLSNTQKVIDQLEPSFRDIPQLFVTGCSAGGIGALQNYAFVRDGLSGTQCSYLLDDSGPAFHNDGPSEELQATVREAWNLDSLADKLARHLDVDSSELSSDFGDLNTVLADHYPRDRLAFSAYRRDFNYSLYSYERFFPGSSPEDIHEFFWADLRKLIRTYDTRKNLAYFIPYFRHDNCSHCVSIPPIGHDLSTVISTPWLGSEIAGSNRDLRAFVVDLIDDEKPLQSYLEEPRSEDFTSEELAMCLDPTS